MGSAGGATQLASLASIGDKWDVRKKGSIHDEGTMPTEGEMQNDVDQISVACHAYIFNSSWKYFPHTLFDCEPMRLYVRDDT